MNRALHTSRNSHPTVKGSGGLDRWNLRALQPRHLWCLIPVLKLCHLNCFLSDTLSPGKSQANRGGCMAWDRAWERG